MGDKSILLVGDNPFHGVSHLSQERATLRGSNPTDPSYAARLVLSSVECGADGFMFTSSETTLSILREIGRDQQGVPLQLYALAPNVTDFVRSAAKAGGVPGLARNLAKEVVRSANVEAIVAGAMGITLNDPGALLRGLLSYEVSRIRSAMGSRLSLVSILLHEVLTDMAIALNMDWLFATHVNFVRKLGLKPGFETRNFVWLTKKLEDCGIDLSGVVIAAPFNAIGFQMCPSKAACEEALSKASQADVIAFSIMAAGYLDLPEAADYVASLPSLRGTAIGVSTMQQATETFTFLKARFVG